MNGPEFVGKPLERPRQIQIGGHSVRPNRIATGRWDHNGSQHRKSRIRREKGSIGVPYISPATSARGIKLNDRGRSIDRTECRMRHQPSQTSSKALLLRVIKMPLITEEDHLVFEQQAVDPSDSLAR